MAEIRLSDGTIISVPDDQLADFMASAPPGVTVVTGETKTTEPTTTAPPPTTTAPPTATAPTTTKITPTEPMPPPLPIPGTETKTTTQPEYWETQIKQAEDLIKQARTSDLPIDTGLLQRDIENYQRKLQLSRGIAQEQIELTPELELLTSKEMQPFVTVNKDDTVNVDVEGMVRTGVADDKIKQLGLTDKEIEQVKALDKLIEYKAIDGYDIGRAVQDGKEDLLKQAGFKPQDIKSIKSYLAEVRQVEASVPNKGLAELPDGNYIDAKALNELKTANPEAYRVLTTEGFNAYDKAVADALNKIDRYRSTKRIPGHEVDTEGNKVSAQFDIKYDIYKFVKDNPDDTRTLKTLGFDDKTVNFYQTLVSSEQNRMIPISDKAVIDNLSDKAREDYVKADAADKFALLQSEGLISPTAGYQGKTKDNEPIVKSDDMTSIGYGLATAPIHDLVINSLPVVGTYRTWNKQGAVGKSISIVADVLSFVFVVGAMAKGAKAVAEAGRMARFVGGMKGLGKGIALELTGPTEVLLHPVSTVKSTLIGLREMAENIGDIRKIPQAIITTSEGTVRLPIRSTTSEKEAMKIRDTLMDLVAKGDRPVIEVNGVKYELGTSEFMKATGGGLVHATPQGEEFAEGLTVTRKPGMPESEQGLFLSNEPLPRFVQSSAFGARGEKPAFIIFPPDIAKDAIYTDKAYMSKLGKVAEMEKKFPEGYEIPKPVQRLYTRIGPEGTRVEILLYNKLSPQDILELKSLALVEDFKAPFKPSIWISGKGLANNIDTLDEAEDLTRILRRAGQDDVARSFLQAYRVSRTTTAARGTVTDAVDIRRLTADSETVTERIEVRATGEPERKIDVSKKRTPVAVRRESQPVRVNRAIGETLRQQRAVQVQRIARAKIPERALQVVRQPRTADITRAIRLPAGTRIPERLRLPERVRVPTRERVPVITRITRKPVITRATKQKGYSVEKGVIHAPKGSVTWRQNPHNYITVKPPYRQSDMLWTRKPPADAVVVPNAKKARDTIHEINGQSPDIEDLLMGFMKIQIHDAPSRPKRGSKSIKFKPSKNSKRKRLQNNNQRVGPMFTRKRGRSLLVSRHKIR